MGLAGNQTRVRDQNSLYPLSHPDTVFYIIISSTHCIILLLCVFITGKAHNDIA